MTLDDIADRMAKLLIALSGVLLIALTCIIAWQIFGRYVLNDTPKWTEQLAGILIVYLALLGGAGAFWEGRHIALDIVQNKLPTPLRQVVERLLLALVASLGIIMLWQGAAMIELVQLWQLPALGISRSFNYLAFPVAGAALTFFSILMMRRGSVK